MLNLADLGFGAKRPMQLLQIPGQTRPIIEISENNNLAKFAITRVRSTHMFTERIDTLVDYCYHYRMCYGSLCEKG